MNDAKEFGGNGSARIRVRLKNYTSGYLRNLLGEINSPPPSPLFDPRTHLIGYAYRCPICRATGMDCCHITSFNPRLPSVGTCLTPERGFVGLKQ